MKIPGERLEFIPHFSIPLDGLVFAVVSDDTNQMNVERGFVQIFSVAENSTVSSKHNFAAHSC